MRNSIAKGVGAILLAGVLAAGVCCAGFASRGEDGKWFKNSNLATWHWKDKTDDKTPDDNPDELKVSNFIVSDKQESGIKLLSAAGSATNSGYYSSHILTATVTPEDADNTLVIWSAAWENPESNWVLDAVYDEDEEDYVYGDAKVVTDYVKVTYSENGQDKDISGSNGVHKTVKVQVLQPFGEPIVVTARSRMDETKFATVKFGYVKRVETATFTGTFMTETNIRVDSSGLYSLYPEWTLSDGTIEPVVTVDTVTFRLMSSKGTLSDCRKDYTVKYFSGFWVPTKYDNFFTREVTVSEAKAYFQMLENEPGPFGIFYTLSLTGGEALPSFKTTYTSMMVLKGVSAEGLTVPVSNVNIDGDSELYF